MTPVFFWDEPNGLQKYSNHTGQFGYDKESGNIQYEFKSQCKACSIGHIKRKVVFHVVVLVILALVGTTQIPHYQQVVMYALKICGVIDHLRVVEVVFPYKSLA